MKKLFSSVMSVLLLLSALFCVPPDSAVRADNSSDSENSIAINTYDDPVICFGPNASGTNSFIFENEAEKENGYGWNNYHERQISGNVLIEDGAGIDGSRGGRVAGVKAAGANWPAYVKIYDSAHVSTSFWSPNFAMFKPETEAVYKISFSYRLTKNLTQDITLSLNAGTEHRNGNDAKETTDEIGTVYILPAGTAATGDEWKTAAGYVQMSSTEYAELYLVLSSTAAYSDPGLYLDNIMLQKADFIPENELVCHNYNGDGGDFIVTVKATDAFSELQTPYVSGKKFDGWYLDEALTQPAPMLFGDVTEVWVKWRTEPKENTNTYDDPVICFGPNASGTNSFIFENEAEKENGYGWNNYHERQISGNVLIEDGAGIDGSRGGRVAVVKAAGANWPAYVKIYKSDTVSTHFYDNFAMFAPTTGTVYKISFSYKLTKALTQDITLSLNAGDIYRNGNDVQTTTEYVGTILTLMNGTAATEGEWVTAEGYITIGDTEYKELYLVLSSASEYSDPGLYLDNITITEVLDVNYITFNTMGGNSLSPLPFISYSAAVKLPLPERDGYVFAGWYTDIELTHSFGTANLPENSIELYAGWEEIAASGYAFETGFETEEYGSVLPYCQEKQDDNTKTAGVKWESTDSGNAASGSGYLSIESYGSLTLPSEIMSAAALINKDGSYYQVVAGQRYKITFEEYSVYGDGEVHYVAFAISDAVPSTGISSSNIEVLDTIRHHSSMEYPGEEWGELTGSFQAPKSGKLYIIVYGRSGTVNIDNLKIEPVGESVVSRVRFYSEDDTLIETQFGLAGEELLTPWTNSKLRKDGYIFDGWREENGNQYIDAVFPTRDIDLYASYVEEEEIGEIEIDWSSNRTFDFEKDSEKASAFYAASQHSTPPYEGLYLVGNDAEGAHSGSIYYKFLKAGQWYQEYYRRMKVFDPDSPGNLVYLEPNSVYRVNFWLKVDKSTQTSMHLATMSVNGKDIISSALVATFVEEDIENDLGQWINYQGEIMTGDEISALGFLITAGYITASLDDITVEYLRDVTVTYNSNGGSEIAPQTWKLYDYVIAPEDPVREGYIFEGWYTDAELNNPYDFVHTEVPGDITLYAKWTPVAEETDEYITVTEYTYSEQTVEKEPEDGHLDAQITITSNDTPSPNADISAPGEDSFPWAAVIAVAGGALLLALGAVIVIIILKKRKTGRES